MIVSANRPIMAVMAMLVSEKGLQQVLSLLTLAPSIPAVPRWSGPGDEPLGKTLHQLRRH
jgi:hypothetical protein